MFPGGPGFDASYMSGDARLLPDVLCSYLIDPPGSGSSTPPPDPAGYSPDGHARFYEEVRRALGLVEVVVLGHSFGATTALTYAAWHRTAPRHVLPLPRLALGLMPMPGREARPGRRRRRCCRGTPVRRGMPPRGR